MSKFLQLLEKIETLSQNVKTEYVPITQALNRILQQDIIADTDMPPFDKSAVDGYACRMEDIGKPLKIIEEIPAGKAPVHKINSGECAKIMTGAPVPQGADCVFMIEDAQVLDNEMVVCTNPDTKRNICYKGEDYKQGEILIKKGTILNPSHIAVIAGSGYTRIRVSQLPVIALITTGSELVEPEKDISGGKIRNSNAYQLMAQLQRMNIPVKYYGIVDDDFNKLKKKLTEVLELHDFVILTGGSSVGEYDYMPAILQKMEFEILWTRTGLKPGNPMTLASKDGKYCFGLSGNPVSSFVQFELLAKPALYKILGAYYRPNRFKAIAGVNLNVKKNSRYKIKPAVIDEQGMVFPVPFNGSADIKALSEAEVLLEIPDNIQTIKKGETVYVRPI